MLDRLKSERRAVRSLVVSTYTSPALIARARAAGARGYIGKNSSEEELGNAARAVLRGETVLGHASIDRERASRSTGPLSDDEFDVLEAIATGLEYTEIAHALSIQPGTVARRMKRVRNKLEAKTNAQAIHTGHMLLILH